MLLVKRYLFGFDSYLPLSDITIVLKPTQMQRHSAKSTILSGSTKKYKNEVYSNREAQHQL